MTKKRILGCLRVPPVEYHCSRSQHVLLFIERLSSVTRSYLNYFQLPFDGSRGSSVSIVSDHRLDDRAIGVRSPAGAKDFSSNLCVETGSGTHPASCTMGTGGTFPGVKSGRGVMLTTHPHLVPRSRMSRSYTSSPPKRHHDVLLDCLAFLLPFLPRNMRLAIITF
jgi:hypothetical protein